MVAKRLQETGARKGRRTMAWQSGRDELAYTAQSGARSMDARRGASQRAAAEAVLDGRRIPYSLRVSPRAQHLRLVIRHEGGLEVVVPRGTPTSRVEQVLREKAQWVVTTLDRVSSEAAAAAPPLLTDGRVLPFAGQHLALMIRTGAPEGRFRALLAGDALTLTVADSRQETIRTALETWYRRRARDIVAERLDVCNAAYGFTYRRVSIKEQKSRWGSCSRKGNLNFNWRLLLAPLPVLDYVVTHELAHLKELNHSPRFWQIVASGCPDHLSHRRWLRVHGRELRF